MEPRHSSWWTEEVRQILAAHGAALCWADRRGRAVTPLWRTAGWGYLRFHEGTAEPWPCYTDRDLRLWAGQVRQAWPPGARRVSVYFNNDPGGAAVAQLGKCSRRWRATPALSSPPGRPRPGGAPHGPRHPDLVSGSAPGLRLNAPALGSLSAPAAEPWPQGGRRTEEGRKLVTDNSFSIDAAAVRVAERNIPDLPGSHAA